MVELPFMGTLLYSEERNSKSTSWRHLEETGRHPQSIDIKARRVESLYPNYSKGSDCRDTAGGYMDILLRNATIHVQPLQDSLSNTARLVFRTDHHRKDMAAIPDRICIHWI